MSIARVVARLRDEPLAAVIGGFWLAVLLLVLPSLLVQDSWLALVSGREVAQHGLPHHDTLNWMTLGHGWVDQQWLGQLVYYGAAALGGPKAALLFHALLVAFAAGLAVACARRRGTSERALPWVMALAGVCLIYGWQMRTQAIAYGLFVVVIWALIRERGAPSSPTIAVVAVALVLWANVHGSVALGATLVAVRAVDSLLARAAGSRRALVLLGVAIVAPFVSPYGASLLGYYHDTLLNSDFRGVVTEWGAPSPGLATAPFYALLGLTAWLVGRRGQALTRFERLVLLVTALGALSAIRNIVWFAFAALILLPVPLARLLRARRDTAPVLLRGALAGTALVAVLAAAAFAVARPAGDYVAGWQDAAERAVVKAARADPAAKVYADVRYADWLLWREPELKGRIAYDIRFELLSRRQLRALAAFAKQRGDHWDQATAGSRVLVLDRADESGRAGSAPAYRRLSAHGAARVVYRDSDTAVLVRPR